MLPDAHDIPHHKIGDKRKDIRGFVNTIPLDNVGDVNKSEEFLNKAEGAREEYICQMREKDEKMISNILKIVLLISLTSCTSLYGEVMNISTSGTHEWVNVVDFKLVNKTVYLLITKERSKIESNLDGHKRKSTFLEGELLISISHIDEFLDEKNKLNFKKVGYLKKESAYFNLDFSDERVKIRANNEFCSIYSGVCKESYVDKTREFLSKESFFSRGYFVVINNEKYERFLGFQDEIKFKVNNGEKNSSKKLNL